MKLISRLAFAASSVFAALGFYLVALGVAGAMLYFGFIGLQPFITDVDSSRTPVQITVALLIGGAVILYSLFPRYDKFVPPGLLLDPEKHPQLFVKIREIANATGQKMPKDVYLVPAINAAVTQRGGFAGIGSRGVMMLGLPALQLFSVPELQAALAHEFGHFYAKDTLAGPWVNSSRRAIARVAENMPSKWLLSIVKAAFRWYGAVFLRLTVSISRKQEYSADALAARTFGAKHLGQALAKLDAGSQLYFVFWQQEFAPLLERGYIAPWAEGFSRFCAAPALKVAADNVLDEILVQSKTAPMDTHPALLDRLHAMNILEKPAIDFSETSAVTLLAGLPEMENELVHFMLRESQGRRFIPVEWDHVGAQVLVPDWTKRLSSDISKWQGATIFGLPEAIAEADLREFGRKFSPASRLPSREELLEYGLGSFGAALSLALIKQGWTISSFPGEGVTLSREDKTVQPFHAAVEIKSGKLLPDAWRNYCAELGIADEPLAAAIL
jgi:heat shock protein HtpX